MVVRKAGATEWITGGGGGGGSGLPAGYDVEVKATEDLAAGLASATEGVYVSGDISITSQITIVGTQRIKFKGGVTVTCTAALAANAAFSVPAGTKLYIQCDGEWIADCNHTGRLWDNGLSTGFIHSVGRILLLQSVITNTIFGGGNIEELEVDLINGISAWRGFGDPTRCVINHIILQGGGFNTQAILQDFSIGTLTTSGNFRPYTTSLITQYGIKVHDTVINQINAEAPGSLGVWITEGAVLAASDFNGGGIYSSVTTGGASAPIVAGTLSRTVFAGADASNKIIMPGEYRDHRSETSSRYYTAFGVGYNNNPTFDNFSQCKHIGGYTSSTVDMQATCDNNDFIGCEFTGLTIQSGAINNRFTNMYLGNITVPSGADMTFVNCRLGNLTISAGADSLFIGCHIAGTLVNSDGLNSRLIGCHDGTGGGFWGNNDGRIQYKKTSTTGNVKTELFIDASALRLTVASDQSYLCNLRLISQRDQQDYAVFQWLGAVIHNDNGTTTIGNGATATTPDTSLNTGSSLTLDIEADNTNDALAVFVTANAAENWSHKLTVDLVEITN